MELLLLSLGAVVFFVLLGVLIVKSRQVTRISLEDRLMQRGEGIEIEKKDSFLDKLEKDLKHSQSGISLSVYFIIMVVSCILICIIANFLVESMPAALIASLAGIFVPREVVRSVAAAKKAEFSMMFSKALKRMAASLRTSSTLPQAVEEIISSVSMPPMIRQEFAKVLSEYNYGVSMQDSFMNLYERTGVEDVKGVALAIDVAAKRGTKLYETFETYAEAVLVRKESEAEAKAALSGAKSTALVGAIIPFSFAAYQKLTNPEYFDPVFALGDGMGKYLMVAVYVYVLLGLYLSMRMADVKL